ncbi:MAG: PilZ domain-containing protein [Hyphomicrobiaceae bacterium]
MPVKDVTDPIQSRGIRKAAARERTEDYRHSSRRESTGQGFVRVPGFRLNLVCRIIDISPTGARLAFTDTNINHLPDRFVLAFGDRTEIDAEIRWRKDLECGVRFLSFFRRLQSPPGSG